MLSSFFSVFIADPQAEHDEEGVFAHGNIDNHTTRKSHYFATIVLLFMAQGNTSDICGKLFAAINNGVTWGLHESAMGGIQEVKWWAQDVWCVFCMGCFAWDGLHVLLCRSSPVVLHNILF